MLARCRALGLDVVEAAILWPRCAGMSTATLARDHRLSYRRTPQPFRCSPGTALRVDGACPASGGMAISLRRRTGENVMAANGSHTFYLDPTTHLQPDIPPPTLKFLVEAAGSVRTRSSYSFTRAAGVQRLDRRRPGGGSLRQRPFFPGRAIMPLSHASDDAAGDSDA